MFYRCARAQRKRPPVVLIHGLGVSSRYFLPIMDILAEVSDVYAPDLPGHGHSPAARRPQDIAALAHDLLAWMDAVGLRQVTLVGQSLGCQVAIEAALREPSRVERVALVGPAVEPGHRRVARQFARLLADVPFERPALVPLVALDYLRMGWRLVPEMRAMFGYPIEDTLPRLGQPLLLVRGEFDPIAPMSWLVRAAHRHGAARVEEIPGWGHAVHFSAPERLGTVLRLFLQESGIQEGERPAVPSPGVQKPNW